jgi:hypothetical protein
VWLISRRALGSCTNRKTFPQENSFQLRLPDSMQITDPPPYPSDASDGGDSTCESTSHAPQWVKVFGIIALVLALLFGILHLMGGGLGRHTHSDSHDDDVPTARSDEKLP